MAKKAKRRIKRVNGKLTVVYVDAETGAVLDNLEGYELHTQDGFSNTDQVAPVEQVEEVATSTPMSTKDKSSNADFWTKSEWATDPKRSKGTGDILGDFRSAAGVLKERVDGVKGTIMNGILTTAGRAIGRNLVADKDNVNAAIGQGVDAAGGAIENITGMANGWLGDTIGGFFGGKPEVPKTGAYGNLQNPEGLNINPQLQAILDEAALRSPYQVVVTSGERVGDTRQHGQNNAVDINLVNPDTGEVLPDYQDGPAFRAYEQFAQTARTVQQNLHPELDNDLRWGGYFTANGSPNGYGAADLMHFDLAGRTIGWGAGGNWATGAANVLKQAYPGLVSEGMGNSKWPLTQPGVSPVPEIQVAENAKRNTTQEQLPRVAQVDPTKMGVDPKLLAALGEIKAKKGEQVLVEGQPISPDMLASVPQSIIERTPVKPPVTQPVEVAQADISPKPVTAAAYIPTPAPEPFKNRRTQPITEAPTALAAANSMATGLDPIKKAYLDTINYAEGNPTNNQAFGVNNYFEPGQGHPNTYNAEFDTTAAGKYQWTKDTWDEYSAKAGVDDFSNEDHQDQAAWKLAEDNYRARTGGDLYAAIQANDATAFTANANRWSSLPTGRHPRTQIPELFGKFNENLGKYNAPVTPVRAPIAPAPKIEQNRETFMSRPKVSNTPTQPTVSTPSRIDKPVANTPVSGKTSNTLSDPTITTSKTGGFMPKTTSDKTAKSSDPRPTPSTPASSSPKINNSPIAGRPASSTPVPSGQKQSRATPVTPSPSSNKIGNQTTTSNSSNKTSSTSGTKTKTSSGSTSSKSYNPTGR